MYAQHYLPDDWYSNLMSHGFIHFDLTSRLPNLTISDDILYSIGTVLARIVPGNQVSDVTIVECVANSPFLTLSNNYAPFHNDGLFFYHLPTFVMLYCDTQAEIGGENHIVRGDLVYKKAPLDLLQYLHSKRIRDTMGDYSVSRHWVDIHPVDKEPVVLFADPNLEIRPAKEDLYSEEELNYLGRLRKQIETCEHTTVLLKAGELLILDNYRVLHARNQFKGHRKLRRVLIRRHAIRAAQEGQNPR